MESILKFKDSQYIKSIEEKYSNKYKNVNIDNFIDVVCDEQNLIDNLIEKIASDKNTMIDENIFIDIISLRELLEKHKQMYLNIDLDFNDANREELLFNLSLIYDHTLSWIETIDNIPVINNNSFTGGFSS